MHVYFLLWGAESAVLRTVADVPRDRATSRVMESAARPLRGETGWAAAGALLAQAQQSIDALDCERRRLLVAVSVRADVALRFIDRAG